MAIKDVYIVTEREKDGEKKSYWNRCGVSFGTNNDGSIPFKLDIFPDVKFQIRERKGSEGTNGEGF
jgi:hypothetical protein